MLKCPAIFSLFFGAFAGCETAPDVTYTAPHIIENNRGGYIHEADAARARLAAWGGRVEIHGVCNSACAIFITLPNACMNPDLKIGFHRSSVNIAGVIGNAQLSRHFRGGVKAQYDAVWGELPDGESHTISAQEFARLDPQSKICAS